MFIVCLTSFIVLLHLFVSCLSSLLTVMDPSHVPAVLPPRVGDDEHQREEEADMVSQHSSLSLSSAASCPPSYFDPLQLTAHKNTVHQQVNLADEPISAEQAYILTNNSKKTLLLLCIGLSTTNDDGTAASFFDIDQDPWKSSLKNWKRSKLKPTRIEFTEEVARRATSFNMRKLPRSQNWSTDKCTRWLQQHPITNETDILFLKKETERLRSILTLANEEQLDILNGVSQKSGGSWRGNLPYLRLIMCLVQDDIKNVFLRRADAQTRQQLDSRNSEVRLPTAFELIASKWNDESFDPVVPPSDCHEDFTESIPCPHSSVSGMAPATPEKVEDIFTSMRSNLLRIIQNWERSGQGEGGHDGEETDDEFLIIQSEEEQFGSLSRRSQAALQNRRSFLYGKPSYLLFFWELADQHQLLQSALQRLQVTVSASDASSAPSIIAVAGSSVDSKGKRRRHRDQSTPYKENADQLLLQKSTESLDALTNSIATWTSAENSRQVRRRIGELEDEARNYRRMYAELVDHSTDLAIFYQNEANDIASQIKKLLLQVEHGTASTRTTD
jgi:hypothetical protein